MDGTEKAGVIIIVVFIVSIFGSIIFSRYLEHKSYQACVAAKEQDCVQPGFDRVKISK